MVISIGLVYRLGKKIKNDPHFNLKLPFTVTTIGAISYLILALGHGSITAAYHSVYYVRYLDWVLTTPILLVALLLVVIPKPTDFRKKSQDNKLIGSVVLADVLMVITLFLASVSFSVAIKRLWFSLSCLSFVWIIWILFGTVRQMATVKGVVVDRVYSKLLIFLSLAMICYPVIWLFGTTATSDLSHYSENILYLILDLLTQVGFWIYAISLLSNVKVKEEIIKPVTEPGDI